MGLKKTDTGAYEFEVLESYKHLYGLLQDFEYMVIHGKEPYECHNLNPIDIPICKTLLEREIKKQEGK